jgi:Uma2 family endonuclease
MPTVTAQPATYGLDASFPTFSVARYLKMVQDGNIDEDDKVELLENYLVRKMSRNPPHDSSVQKVQRVLSRHLPEGWELRTQLGLQLPDSVPEPDLTVARIDPDDYETRHPLANDVGLVVEVSDTSLTRDLQDKARIYARAGVAVYWVVDLVHRQITVFAEPSGQAGQPSYAQAHVYSSGTGMPFVLAGVTLASVPVDDLLPRIRS